MRGFASIWCGLVAASLGGATQMHPRLGGAIGAAVGAGIGVRTEVDFTPSEQR